LFAQAKKRLDIQGFPRIKRQDKPGTYLGFPQTSRLQEPGKGRKRHGGNLDRISLEKPGQMLCGAA
jgi:hypothetical protein